MKPKPGPSDPIEVLLADSSQIQVQLLTSAMRRHPECKVASCPLDVDIILSTLRDSLVDVLLLAGNTQGGAGQDKTLLRRLHISYPRVPRVLLLESFDRDLVVNAFGSGARGLFYFTESPFRSLCKCIQVVDRGQIWAPAELIDYLVDLVSQVPSLCES
jgi:DNA-binding NarL/FixJ family response regulator